MGFPSIIVSMALHSTALARRPSSSHIGAKVGGVAALGAVGVIGYKAHKHGFEAAAGVPKMKAAPRVKQGMRLHGPV